MITRAHRIINMVPSVKNHLDGQQSPSDVQCDNIINHERNVDDTNSLPDSQFSLDILTSGEDNEDIQEMPPKHRILNKPSLVIQETDSNSDFSSDESSSYSSRSRSGSSSSSSSSNTLNDFSSDDSVKDPTYYYEDPFPGNNKAQSDFADKQQPQAQLPCIQDFLQSAVDNQELFNINSLSPRVNVQPPSVDEHPTSVSEQSPSVDVESRSSCRKRKAQPLLWKRNQSKLLKNKGMSYTSMSNSKKVYNAKKMGPVCYSNCKLKCSERFTVEERKHIFEKFWDCGDLEIQRHFIHDHMNKIEPKYRYVREGSSRKNFNHAFYLTRNNKNSRVCKVFFMNTLAISDTMIRTVVKKQSETGLHLKDNRGKHNKHKTLDSVLTDCVKAHINSIPRIESHYCRARSTREYIEGGFTVAALHRHYVEKCESEGAPYVSYQVYYNIFVHDFNLSFWQPKKDQCEDCMAYQNAEDKSLLQETYVEHLKQKTLARTEKDRDKELVSNTFVVAVYDLQAVMPCPRGDVSNFYYTSKLNLFNFTITEIGIKDTTCYVWHEGEGARGFNEIGSCVLMYLRKLNDNATEPCDVTFYSDNCCGQQKNKFMVAMYQYATQKLPNIKSTHKFLIKGHTQNEGDCVHSVIQRNITRALKSSPIYVPDQYITLIKTAKKTGKPYTVKELTHDNFFDLKPLCTGNYNIDDDGNKFKWTDIKVMMVDKVSNGMFFIKTSYEEKEFRLVSTLRKRRTKSKTEFDKNLTLNQLYTEKLIVPEAKKQGILKLIQKNVVPRFYESFYANL